jgi:hypothetical protein
MSRELLQLELRCEKHPYTKLKLNYKDSKIGADSAYKMNVEVIVTPCIECQKQLWDLQQAIYTFTKTSKEFKKIEKVK